MVSILAVLIVLGTVFAVLLGGRRGHGFRPGLAKTQVRSASGPNFGSMVAVVAIATLVVEAGSLPVLKAVPAVAPLIAALTVVLVIGVIVGRTITEVIVASLAVVVLGVSIGVTGTLTLIVLITLMWWLLGALRGWMGEN